MLVKSFKKCWIWRFLTLEFITFEFSLWWISDHILCSYFRLGCHKRIFWEHFWRKHYPSRAMGTSEPLGQKRKGKLSWLVRLHERISKRNRQSQCISLIHHSFFCSFTYFSMKLQKNHRKTNIIQIVNTKMIKRITFVLKYS